jgi:TubC N-terminal docking domain
MLVGKLLDQIDEAGIVLSYFPEEDRLNAKPTAALTPELVDHIREHRTEIIRIMQDEEMRRTGIIQSEYQVFGLAREYFGLDENEGAA